MHPTFASFKNFKQNPNKKLQTDSVTSQPRTFQQLKNISSTQKNTKITKLPTKTFKNIVSQKQGHIKKCSSGISFQLLTASRNSQNQIVKIKNPDNVVPSYTKKTINNQSRPTIIAPSLLKNKSFIQPCSQVVSGAKLLTGRSLYSISNNESIQLSDQLSDSVNRSIENSYEQGNSYEKSSNILSNSFKDTLDLDTRQRETDIKMSFSRNSSRSQLYKLENKMSLPQTTKLQESLNEFTVSKDMYSSIQSNGTLCKSYQATQKKNQNSINFSKKFKYFKHQKQQQRFFNLQDFNLIDEIGEGKYGKVYSAQHKETNFICALKIISKALIRQQNIEEPFLRQIKIQMYLNHPNIVKLYGFFHDQDNIYLIMQSCLDGQLFKMMKDRKNFQQNQILSILSDIYEAVSFLHCHGIIHRDLKPQNIVIQNGVYKLCDFGWAAYAKGQSRSTFCGTPLYVSPQVLKGSQYDVKADVWGLGVLTYQLAYGRVPFPIWNKSDMVKIVKDPVYFPSWTNVSEKMQSLIKWMLQKQPESRATMNQILSGGLVNQYLGKQKSIRSQIQLLF